MKWTMMLMLLMAVAVTLVAASPIDESDEENALFAADDDSNDSDTSAEDDDTDDELTRVARAADSTGRQRERGQGRKAKANKKNPCRYNKGPWSDCDTTTNQRSRSLTLKKGDASCEQTKSITKPCKKAKGAGGRRNRN